MLGSSFEFDDAVQDTLVRAWCALDGFEGRASLRSWRHRIATNVCLDMRRARSGRAGPREVAWLEPDRVGGRRSARRRLAADLRDRSQGGSPTPWPGHLRTVRPDGRPSRPT